MYDDDDDDRPSEAPRPTTPLPDSSRTLRRTESYASIDTVRPLNKGIRRCITEIAQNLKIKAENKRKKHAPTQPRKSPLQSVHRSDEAVIDRIHSGIPLDLESLVDVPLFLDEDILEVHNNPCELGGHPTDHQPYRPQAVEIDIKDVQLTIHPFETNITIWDGLGAAHHVFKCRLLLRCTTHPYDTVSLPNIRRVEMDCSTRPAGSRYARPPLFQASYDGATPCLPGNPCDPPTLNSAAGIRMDKVWCKIVNGDGTWGWYRDAFVPFSPRLFDKMDYREFKLVSRVWVGESSTEGELTFGISMLLGAVDMKRWRACFVVSSKSTTHR